MRPLLLAALARVNAPIEKSAFHRVARERKRCLEMRARGRVLSATKLELAQRGGIERIGGEAIAVLDRVDFRKPAFGAVALRNRDGAIERDNRGGPDRHQRVVQ